MVYAENNVSTLEELMEVYQSHQSLWFYVDEDVKEQFVEECNRLGYAFKKDSHKEEKSFTIKQCGNCIALHYPDKTIWYVSSMCWHYSFTHPQGVVSIHSGKGGGPFFRVNYKRFINGEDYLYHTSNQFLWR